MLRHAFETLGCIRVELKTDSLNERSRKAILRIGAQEEGTFRNHMITASGRIRHTVYYSIIDSEWPAVKAGPKKSSEIRRNKTHSVSIILAMSRAPCSNPHAVSITLSSSRPQVSECNEVWWVLETFK